MLTRQCSGKAGRMPGEGTTIEFFLPQVERQIEVPPAPEAGDYKGDESILFIDDYEEIVTWARLRWRLEDTRSQSV